jgi:hypothetical protein
VAALAAGAFGGGDGFAFVGAVGAGRDDWDRAASGFLLSLCQRTMALNQVRKCLVNMAAANLETNGARAAARRRNDKISAAAANNQ